MINSKWEYEIHLLETGDVYKYITFGMLMTVFGQVLLEEELEDLRDNPILQLELLNFESGVIDEFQYKDILLKRIRILL